MEFIVQKRSGKSIITIEPIRSREGRKGSSLLNWI